jgi:hypothetical protein
LQTLSTENRRTTISNSKRQKFLPFKKKDKNFEFCFLKRGQSGVHLTSAKVTSFLHSSSFAAAEEIG